MTIVKRKVSWSDWRLLCPRLQPRTKIFPLQPRKKIFPPQPRTQIFPSSIIAPPCDPSLSKKDGSVMSVATPPQLLEQTKILVVVISFVGGLVSGAFVGFAVVWTSAGLPLLDLEPFFLVVL